MWCFACVVARLMLGTVFAVGCLGVLTVYVACRLFTYAFCLCLCIVVLLFVAYVAALLL